MVEFYLSYGVVKAKIKASPSQRIFTGQTGPKNKCEENASNALRSNLT